jgi:tetratricopeptide (TPR) repeat protein
MLEWAVEEDPLDARMWAYLAREYYFHQRWEDVIRTAGRLAELESGWNVERSATWRNCGFAYQQLGNMVDAEQWYLRGTTEALNQLEAWFSLSQFYYTQERWLECFEAAEKVGSLKPDTHYLADEATIWRMYDMLALSCWNLGKKGSAKKFARLATELNPDELRLKENYAYMISAVVKEYNNGLSNGLSD